MQRPIITSKTIRNAALLLCLQLFNLTTAVQAQQLGTLSPADSALSALSHQMFDSAGTSGFFPLYQRGLAEAVASKSTRYEYIFRTGLLAHYKVMKQKDRYLAAADSLIQLYQERKDEPQLYRVWTLKINNIQSWGDQAEAVRDNQRMADYAQAHNHPIGIAQANYFFGRNYHNNNQPAEADRYYRLALSQFARLKTPGNVFNCSIDLMILEQNRHRHAEALALSDTLPSYIRASEKENGISLNPVFRMKLARLRLQSFCVLKDIPRATVERDSMLYYNQIYPDRNVQASVQWALARYAQLTKDYPEARRILTALKEQYEQQSNYPKLAETLVFLAEVEMQQGDYAAAAQSYTAYVTANDSANIELSTQQLNQLTKQFRLNELEQEKRVVEAEVKEIRTFAWSAGIIAALVILFCLSLLFYSHRLRQKNHALYQQYQQKKQSEEMLDKIMAQSPADEMPDKDMQLFMEIRKLLQNEELLSDLALDRNTLAEKLNTNHAYISNAVQAGANMSVKKYINQVRIDYACTLLKQKDKYIIAEIQDRCGFQSRSSFNRAFKDALQMTPSDFMKELGRE